MVTILNCNRHEWHQTFLATFDTVAMVQDIFAAGAPCVSTLRDLSLLCTDGPESVGAERPDLDLRCLSRLSSLRTLALQGVQGICSAPDRLHLPSTLTALLLHGFEDVNGQTSAARFGQSLLPMQQLQCLDVEVVICRPGGSPCSPLAVEALMKTLHTGLQPALLMLPLRLGARVDVTGPTVHKMAGSSITSQTPLHASLKQWLT